MWVNEKDHMRIITTEDGADLQHAFQRFCNVVRQIENVCKMEGAGEHERLFGGICRGSLFLLELLPPCLV
eukprot:COSAG05_NODE_196_length_14546_cov_55.423548_9_plen_70_part_00